MQTEKINNIIIKPVKNSSDKRPYKYEELFDEPFFNLFLNAKKKSGKSTIISNLLDHIATDLSLIRIYSTTYEKDDVMLETLKKLNKYKIQFECYSDLKSDDKNYNDILDKQFAQADEWIKKNGDKLKKFKYRFPLLIYIFDDFNQYLRHTKSINDLATKNRHYKSIVIYSGQKYEVIQPKARENLNYMFLFKNQGENKLRKIYEELIPNSIPYETFLDMYYEATSTPYSFLYINLNDPDDFRKNFNERFILN